MMNHPISPLSPKWHLCLTHFSAGKRIGVCRKRPAPKHAPKQIFFLATDYFVHTKPGKRIAVNPALMWCVTHVLHSSCVFLSPPSQNGSVLILHWAGVWTWTCECLLPFGPFKNGHGTVCGPTKKTLLLKIALNFSGSNFCLLHTFLLLGNSHHHPKESN